MNSATLLIDDVYLAETPVRKRPVVRRVIALVQDRCIYSTGGDRNRHCRIRTMQHWIRRSRAELTHRRADCNG